MNLPFLKPRPSPAPYLQGYLNANATGAKQMDGGIVRMPPQIFSEGSAAQAAYYQGIADSIADRGPRKPYHRVSRAHPPWRMI